MSFHNLINALNKGQSQSHYNGYGSCPLTVERGKIILAEFGYGGKLLPPGACLCVCVCVRVCITGLPKIAQPPPAHTHLPAQDTANPAEPHAELRTLLRSGGG